MPGLLARGPGGAAAQGCLLERLTTPQSGKTTWEHVFDGVRAVGIERTIFSSDCGNPDYPAVEDGLFCGPTGCSPRPLMKTKCER